MLNLFPWPRKSRLKSSRRSFDAAVGVWLAVLIGASALVAVIGLTHFQSQQALAALMARQSESLALRAETFGRADSVVIGDSILGSVTIDCGRSFAVTIPAGRSTEVLPSARKVLDIVKPQVAVVGIGTNDQRDLRRAAQLQPLAKWDGRIIWVLPANAPLTSKAMIHLAKQRGETVYRYDGATLDGIHPDRRGRTQISSALSQRCQEELRR